LGQGAIAMDWAIGNWGHWQLGPLKWIGNWAIGQLGPLGPLGQRKNY